MNFRITCTDYLFLLWLLCWECTDYFKTIKIRFPKNRVDGEVKGNLKMSKIRDWAREDPAKSSKKGWLMEHDKDHENVAPWNWKKGTDETGMEWLCFC
jgi:hypothetical protein